MPFAAAGAGLGAVGSMVGAGKQADATRDAASTQAASADKATQLQRDQFTSVQANEAPFLTAGNTAVSQLMGALPGLTQGFDPTAAGIPAQFGYTGADLNNDPAFKFAMDQGTQAIQRTAAAKGSLLSPATMKSVGAFATGTADQFYGNDFNRALQTYTTNYGNAFNTFKSNQTDAFSKLSGITGMGLNAATGVNAAGTNFANQAGEYTLQAGNAGAAGIIGGANAFANGAGGVSASMQNLFSNPNFQSYAKKAFSGSSYGNQFSTGPAPQPVSQSQWDSYDSGGF